MAHGSGCQCGECQGGGPAGRGLPYQEERYNENLSPSFTFSLGAALLRNNADAERRPGVVPPHTDSSQVTQQQYMVPARTVANGD